LLQENIELYVQYLMVWTPRCFNVNVGPIRVKTVGKWQKQLQAHNEVSKDTSCLFWNFIINLQ